MYSLFVLFLFLLAHDDKCTAFGSIFKNPLLNIITALKKSVISAPLFAYYFGACTWCVRVCVQSACVRAFVYFFLIPIVPMAHCSIYLRSQLQWSLWRVIDRYALLLNIKRKINSITIELTQIDLN